MTLEVTHFSKAKLAKAIVLTRPISNYIDHLSFVETVRGRLRLRLQGVLPPTSSCTVTEEEFLMANMNILTGDAGLDCLHEYFNVLQTRSDFIWSEDFGITEAECMPLVITAISDCWRRLVLPFWGMPWKLFKIISMDTNDGLKFLQSVGVEAGDCCKCQDRFFGLVSLVHTSMNNLCSDEKIGALHQWTVIF